MAPRAEVDARATRRIICSAMRRETSIDSQRWRDAATLMSLFVGLIGLSERVWALITRTPLVTDCFLGFTIPGGYVLIALGVGGVAASNWHWIGRLSASRRLVDLAPEVRSLRDDLRAEAGGASEPLENDVRIRDLRTELEGLQISCPSGIIRIQWISFLSLLVRPAEKGELRRLRNISVVFVPEEDVENQ